MGCRMVEFDVTKHELVPEHKILSEKEAKELLERYHIKPEQLPKILARDPCARIIGAEPGQIIKIIRPSPTAGVSEAYRLVVEG